MRYIIGVSGYFHESSVCLLKHGKIIEFVKEESLTRIKGSRGFPFRALTFLTAKYGLNNDNIDHIAFYEKPLRGWALTTYNSLVKPKRSFVANDLSPNVNAKLISFDISSRTGLKISVEYTP